MSFHTGVGIARQPEPQSRFSPILDRGEGRSAIGTAEALGAAVGDRPYVGNPDGDLDAAGAAASGWRTLATRCSPRSMTSSGSMRNS
jgi:hypothetical protein